MSGGHYDYAFHHIDELAERLESDIKKYSAKYIDGIGDEYPPLPKSTLKFLRKSLDQVRLAARIAHDVEWYFSGDYGDDTLAESLKSVGVTSDA